MDLCNQVVGGRVGGMVHLLPKYNSLLGYQPPLYIMNITNLSADTTFVCTATEPSVLCYLKDFLPSTEKTFYIYKCSLKIC